MLTERSLERTSDRKGLVTMQLQIQVALAAVTSQIALQQTTGCTASVQVSGTSTTRYVGAIEFAFIDPL
jgi:hypothetical protein